jgi:hypothetical protein
VRWNGMRIVARCRTNVAVGASSASRVKIWKMESKLWFAPRARSGCKLNFLNKHTSMKQRLHSSKERLHPQTFLPTQNNRHKSIFNKFSMKQRLDQNDAKRATKITVRSGKDWRKSAGKVDGSTVRTATIGAEVEVLSPRGRNRRARNVRLEAGGGKGKGETANRVGMGICSPVQAEIVPRIRNLAQVVEATHPGGRIVLQATAPSEALS